MDTDLKMAPSLHAVEHDVIPVLSSGMFYANGVWESYLSLSSSAMAFIHSLSI